MEKTLLENTAKHIKKLFVGIIGFTVVLIGVVMIVLPGPAIIVIPVGLGILATEFIWARRLLRKIKSSPLNHSVNNYKKSIKEWIISKWNGTKKV